MAVDLTTLLHRYLQAWRDNDSDILISMFAPDAVYIDVPHNETFTGKSLIDHLKKGAFENCEKMEYVLQNEVAFTETGVAFQYVMQGYNRHGEWISMEGADFLEFRNDKIIRVKEYYNWEQVLSGENIASAPKYKKSGLQPEHIKRYQQHLTQLMEHAQLYRDNTLTLATLAVHVGISVNHLSQVINTAFGINFFEFVNRYRIEDAKKQLRESAPQQGLVLAIALSVGFTSSATFYAAFKKITHTTPTAYRRAHHTA